MSSNLTNPLGQISVAKALAGGCAEVAHACVSVSRCCCATSVEHAVANGDHSLAQLALHMEGTPLGPVKTRTAHQVHVFCFADQTGRPITTATRHTVGGGCAACCIEAARNGSQRHRARLSIVYLACCDRGKRQESCCAHICRYVMLCCSATGPSSQGW